MNKAMRLGIVAGAGSLPLHSAREARAKGIDLIIYTVAEEIAKLEDYSEFGDRVKSVVLLRFGEFLKTLKKDNITHLILIGKVSKEHIFSDFRPDLKAVSMLASMKSRNDDSFFYTMLREFEKIGMEVLPQSTYLKANLMAEGIYSRKKPGKEDKEDIQFGMYYASQIGRLDIGQTVVVRRKSVLAVEAIEGTDACIRRGGTLSRGKGAVVCKCEKPAQDRRFDIPTVGLNTLDAMKGSGAHVLAIEAGRTFVSDPQQFFAYANRLGIIVVAVKVPTEPV